MICFRRRNVFEYFSVEIKDNQPKSLIVYVKKVVNIILTKPENMNNDIMFVNDFPPELFHYLYEKLEGSPRLCSSNELIKDIEFILRHVFRNHNVIYCDETKKFVELLLLFSEKIIDMNVYLCINILKMTLILSINRKFKIMIVNYCLINTLILRFSIENYEAFTLLNKLLKLFNHDQYNIMMEYLPKKVLDTVKMLNSVKNNVKYRKDKLKLRISIILTNMLKYFSHFNIETIIEYYGFDYFDIIYTTGVELYQLNWYDKYMPYLIKFSSIYFTKLGTNILKNQNINYINYFSFIIIYFYNEFCRRDIRNIIFMNNEKILMQYTFHIFSHHINYIMQVNIYDKMKYLDLKITFLKYILSLNFMSGDIINSTFTVSLFINLFKLDASNFKMLKTLELFILNLDEVDFVVEPYVDYYLSTIYYYYKYNNNRKIDDLFLSLFDFDTFLTNYSYIIDYYLDTKHTAGQDKLENLVKNLEIVEKIIIGRSVEQTFNEYICIILKKSLRNLRSDINSSPYYSNFLIKTLQTLQKIFVNNFKPDQLEYSIYRRYFKSFEFFEMVNVSYKSYSLSFFTQIINYVTKRINASTISSDNTSRNELYLFLKRFTSSFYYVNILFWANQLEYYFCDCQTLPWNRVIPIYIK